MDRFVSEGAIIHSSENAERLFSAAALKSACAEGYILEQRASLFDKNKNLIVPLGPVKGVMPYLECAAGLREGKTRDISVISRVGKPVCFVITGFSSDERGNPVALLSRRAVQQRYIDERISRIVPGDIIDCRVTHIERFGCFADIGYGISALLPIDAISVSRISHPSDRICVGMELKCVVRAIDEAGRLLLSHKELLGTWEQNAAFFSPGETVVGTVRSIEEYGIFVELRPNLAGLADRADGVEISQSASVFIKSIIPERMKIKLVIIDSFAAKPQKTEPFEYFIEGGHIDRFVYSPPACSRISETVFPQK
jgi:small subunit ribosomal protein S1